MKKIIPLIVATLMITCCTENRTNNALSKNQNIKPIYLKIDYKESGFVKLDTIIDELSYIPLEKTDPYLGNVRKLLIYENHFIIWDGKGKAVWIFDNTGKLTARISRLGKAEDEYISIGNVSVSRSGIISIIDPATKSILKYDLKGNFIDRQKVPGFPSDFVENNNYQYVFYHQLPQDKPNQFYLNVLQNKVFERGFFPYKATWRYDGDHFVVSREKIYFYRKYDNNIYLLNEDEMFIAINIDFGESQLKNDALVESDDLEESHRILNQSVYVGEISKLCLSDSFLTFHYNMKDNEDIETASVIYNLHSGICYNYRFALSSSRFNISPNIPLSTDGAYNYDIIEPWQIHEDVRKEFSEKFNMEEQA